MGFFYRGLSLLYVFIFVWSVAILRSTDGGNITWYKPPPTETITDPTVASKTNTTLTKGSLNEELSCEFRLTADLSIITVTMMFGINTIATYASSTVLVDPRFESRGNATWIPTKLKLIVFNVTASDEGLYSCKVLTASGSWIREIQVTVLDQASITFISANQTVVVGDLLFLNCSAIGTPPARITWTRLSDDKIVDMPLIITGKQDGGGYRCTADNKVGKPVTSDVFITFHYPVEATGLGENATVRQGGKKTFSCPVDGNPKPNISWYKSSEVGQTPIFVGEELEAEVTGCYTCVASNPLGTSINIKQCLTVEESPTASSTPTSAPKGPSQTVIGVVIGVAVFVVIMIGLVTWWVWKEKKCRKHTKK